ncbi:MAG: hypothetical protein NVS3B20_07980 [Polyangiales bacterium]
MVLVATATAATATATTAAATATAAAAAVATTATTTTAAAAALRTIFGFVHAKSATVENGATHLSDGFLSLLRRAHGHEAEASRLTTVAIRHDVNVGDFTAVRGERRSEGFVIGIE